MSFRFQGKIVKLPCYFFKSVSAFFFFNKAVQRNLVGQFKFFSCAKVWKPITILVDNEYVMGDCENSLHFLGESRIYK